MYSPIQGSSGPQQPKQQQPTEAVKKKLSSKENLKTSQPITKIQIIASIALTAIVATIFTGGAALALGVIGGVISLALIGKAAMTAKKVHDVATTNLPTTVDKDQILSNLISRMNEEQKKHFDSISIGDEYSRIKFLLSFFEIGLSADQKKVLNEALASETRKSPSLEEALASETRKSPSLEEALASETRKSPSDFSELEQQQLQKVFDKARKGDLSFKIEQSQKSYNDYTFTYKNKTYQPLAIGGSTKTYNAKAGTLHNHYHTLVLTNTADKTDKITIQASFDLHKQIFSNFRLQKK